MYRIGVSLLSARDRLALQAAYVKPMRRGLREERIGYWSNHLIETPSGSPADPLASPLRNHLLLFEVYDFKRGINFLRERFSLLSCPPSTQFLDLTESQRLY